MSHVATKQNPTVHLTRADNSRVLHWLVFPIFLLLNNIDRSTVMKAQLIWILSSINMIP